MIVVRAGREQCDGGGIGWTEVEFADPTRTTGGESARRALTRRQRAKVGGAITIRDRSSPDHKRCRPSVRRPVLRLGRCVGSAKAESSGFLESMPARVKFQRIGGISNQAWNMRFNSIQRGKHTRVRAGVRSPAQLFASITGRGWGAEAECRGRSCPELCMATSSPWGDLQVNSGKRRDPDRQFREVGACSICLGI